MATMEDLEAEIVAMKENLQQLLEQSNALQSALAEEQNKRENALTEEQRERMLVLPVGGVIAYAGEDISAHYPLYLLCDGSPRKQADFPAFLRR